MRTSTLAPERKFNLLKDPVHIVNFSLGYLAHLLLGHDARFASGSMSRLFILTDSKINQFTSQLQRRLHPPYPFQQVTGALGQLDAARIQHVAAQIERDGYYVFENRLPAATCQRIIDYAVRTPCIPVDQTTPVIYPRDKPQANRYDFLDEQNLLEMPDIQALTFDESFLAIAQAYLGFRPVQDLTGMWWSAAFSNKPSSTGAQLYHFDLDRLAFIKFFVCLTDVTAESGPHCFVRGSHRNRPTALNISGRIPDEDIARYFSPEDLIEFVCPQGTIIAEDTRGLHKGKRLEKGERLMLEVEFADSLFPGGYNKIRVSDHFSPATRDRLRQHTHTYQRFR